MIENRPEDPQQRHTARSADPQKCYSGKEECYSGSGKQPYSIAERWSNATL
ncbi:hypothetical protein L195_g034528 [Trifolium pratense]|uniref:Uncharacterized protein n=1 Tax=Trifolium pratense TaxID=57577 RepID=A0A2K3LJ28_TRIPR|nr:hypothetical protein L195_g034528 [Trifolium pratense]